MDENFLKDTKRAHELLACMQRDDRLLKFLVFSSAESIDAFGVENLARLGVEFLWLGAESKHETYAKNTGRDLRALVRDLRNHGINVLVSGILFLEHHTPDNIDEDIQYLIELEGVYTQFMMFTPLPQTRLYLDYKERGLIDFDLPYEEWHGQHVLNFRHPAFSKEDSKRILNRAFQAEFDQLSSSVVRMFDTAMRGYRTLSASPDPWLRRRGEQMRESVVQFRLLAPTMRRFAHNSLESQRVIAAEKEATRLFGPPSVRDRTLQLAGRTLAEIHSIKRRLFGDMAQPKMRLERFHWPDADKSLSPLVDDTPKLRLPVVAPDAP